MTTVVVADDEALVREGLSAMLARRGINVLAAVGDGRSAIQAVEIHHPDVVLMDIQMPDLDGIDATAAIVGQSDTRVLVLTTYHQDEYVFQALRAGASGFLLKTAQPDRLAQAIELVAAGEALLAPEVTARLIADHVSRPAPRSGSGAPQAPVPAQASGPERRLATLTPREREVLVLIAQGLSNAAISAELALSTATVKTHVNRILAKLGLSSRVQLVVLAYEVGLVHPGRR